MPSRLQRETAAVTTTVTTATATTATTATTTTVTTATTTRSARHTDLELQDWWYGGFPPYSQQ